MKTIFLAACLVIGFGAMAFVVISNGYQKSSMAAYQTAGVRL